MRSLVMAAVVLASVTTPAAASTAGRYIVVLNQNADVASVADAHGGQVHQRWNHALRGYSVQATAAQARQIARDPRVAEVQPNRKYTADEVASWGLDRIDQRALPLDGRYDDSIKGEGVTAYVIDSGIRTTHATFEGRATLGVNTADNDPTDCLGHGTHVAGTIGGREYGVAKGIRLVSVKVLGCEAGSTESVLAGIEWVTANARKPAIANMSITAGDGVVEEVVEDAIRASIRSGITYTASAGNKNADSCLSTPSRMPEVITVGATDINDARASFSNTGKCVDIFAPGRAVVSADYRDDTGARTLSGTSMAAPHVAGAAALYLATHPYATPPQVQDGLTRMATPDVVREPGAGSPNRLLYTGLVH